jgi:hypothetical protein
VSVLRQPVVLTIKNLDIFDAHAAIRHISEIEHNGHSVYTQLPKSLRTNRGFTPWLVSAKTVKTRLSEKFCHRPSVCTLEFVGTTRHIHQQAATGHAATFDVRVAGGSTRALFDTGATCSCVSARLAKRLGLDITPASAIEHVGGVGGTVKLLGYVSCPVKLRKHQLDQLFYVVQDPIAGYDCLLGEDFMQSHCGGIFFTPQAVHFAIGCELNCMGDVIFSRRLTGSVSSRLQHRDNPWTLPLQVVVCEPENESELASHKERRKLLHEIALGRAVAYRLILKIQQSDQSVEQTKGEAPMPEAVQRVIDKHSAPGGTLCGTIPDNTSARGFECHIELIPGANPVQVKQYRLTPREREELLEKVKAFILKGWIEPSTSPWCSSVLFVPKPGNKLRFCVDFRGLNQRTVQNSGPIPLQGELLDKLEGHTMFIS